MEAVAGCGDSVPSMSDPDPAAEDETMDAPEDAPQDQAEDEVDAPFWTKALLTLLPFALLAALLSLDSCRSA